MTIMHLQIDGIYYDYILENDTIEVARNRDKFPGYSGAVIIPPTVKLHNGTYKVKRVGVGAFSNCTGLTSIDIPDTVTSIENFAFSGCTGLTTINIPSSVKLIGENAFSDCFGLTSVTIPKSVKIIGVAALCDCHTLTSIIVETDNPHYDSRNNCNAIIDSKTNILIAGCVKTVIPNDVVEIEEFTFCGCDGLTTINIPNSVTSIGDEAFALCKDLTFMDIPDSVKTIGYKAFDNCPSLVRFQCHYHSLDDVSIYEDAFDPGLLESCTLIVPSGTESIYQQHKVFGKFKKMETEGGK